VGRASIVSVEAPYACEQCGHETTRLLEIARIQQGGRVVVPEFPCVCGGCLTLDDLPERYFGFLR
jgi:hypothetical protein